MILTSARAKFERARLHRAAFHDAGFTWLERHQGKPYPMAKRVEGWVNGGEVVVYSVGRYETSVPDEIAAIVGDALFGYRCALDHLAWHLVPEVEKLKGRSAENVYFPVSFDAGKFTDQARTMIPGVGAVATAVIRRYQPFLNGLAADEHPLSVLHHWNRFDKHRALPVIVAAARTIDMTVPGDFENFQVLRTERRPDPPYLIPEMELVRIFGRRRNPRKDHGVRVQMSAEVTIAHESGRAIDGALNAIDAIVDEVLREFERLPTPGPNLG